MTTPPGQVASLVLGTVHMWHLKGDRSKVVDLIVRHFSAFELLEARKQLCTAVGEAAEPVARRDSDQRTAAAAQAVDLLDQVGYLDSQGKLPVIVVPSTMLSKVPVGTLLTSDDVAVSARLENLERSVQVLADSVSKVVAVAAPLNGPVGFGGARARVNSNSGGRGGGQCQGGLQGVPQVSVTPPAGFTSWAGLAGAAAAVQGATGLQLPLLTGRERLGSDSEKRKRVDGDQNQEFRQQGRQRGGRKVAIGKSTVAVDEGGQAAPLEYYVGNTTPRANPEIIKGVLVKCAADLQKDLEVLEVKCLTTGIDNPRTKSWRVKVPYKFKELMEKNELYPEGWTYRKFFAPRNANQGTGGAAKKPRPDDQLVEDYLQQQQQKPMQSGETDEGDSDKPEVAGA